MKGILLATHSQYKPVCTKIATALPPAEYDVIIVDENTPQALAAREEAVRWCAMFVIVGSVRYQRNPYCLELANYAKTIRKPIITILAQNKYKPFGAIGAISVAGATVIDFTNDFLNAIEILKKELESKAWATDLPKPNLAESGSAANSQKTSKSSAGVLISYQKDAWHVAEMIKSVLGLATTYINPSQKSGQEDAISGCQVFVAVLSPDYQSSAVSQRCYEMARVYRKRIIPVIGSAKYQPSDWLALAIAGKLYYAMPDRESAYKKFYDSSLINDFRYAVEAFLQPHASEEEREAKEIQALDKQLEECKGKLPSWPPKPRPQETKVDKVESAMKNITVGEGKKDLPFNYIHHEVTRMSFVPPKPLFDARGMSIHAYDLCRYNFITTTRKSIFKLVKVQSLVAKCCTIRKI